MSFKTCSCPNKLLEQENTIKDKDEQIPPYIPHLDDSIEANLRIMLVSKNMTYHNYYIRI